MMNQRIKVMTIFGTRPEAIKMAPVVLELQKHPHFIESIVVTTAQHREMLDQVLHVFHIVPDYDLHIMKDRQTLSDITVKALTGLDEIIKRTEPDLILVHGDTTTTFVASLAAYYNKVKIGHVEAGLRTGNKYEPYPEEMNRMLTGVLADFHFAPTERAKRNLLKEAKPEASIFVTGNTVIDALKTTVQKDYSHPVLDAIGNRRMILMTAHRRENLGRPMEHIFHAVRRIADEHEDVDIVYPIHLNPYVRDIAYKLLAGHERIHLTDPFDVFDFHNFMARAYLILTDSGGIQEEAPSFGVPVLVLRNTTERPEGIESGNLKLAGTSEEYIYELTKQLLSDEEEYHKMSKAANPYGDGRASERIVEIILEHYLKKEKIRI
jgi:UDP-N-acetylglucosamine 2-epimerase (non-hydrolysing)